MAKRVTNSGIKAESQAGSSGRAWALGVVAVWLVLSLVSASQRYADSVQTSSPANFLVLLFWSLVVWSYWALATPLVFRLGEIIPLRKKRLVSATLTHFALALLFGLLHTAFVSLLAVLFSTPRPGVQTSWLVEFGRGVRVFLYVELILYWAILGAGIARDSYRKYLDREMRSRELETQLGLARLEALRMQIHPHFLFNALNTVAMLVRNNEGSQAVEMVAGLGELLRSSLADHPQQEVPLAAELSFVRRYLAIEEFRFPDRLRVEVDVPEELLQAQVPNLILQPLVENAIRHGVAKSSSPGLVRISARRANGWLELSVEDDGPGLPAGWLMDASGGGIGLRNVRSRMEQLYGVRQEFSIQNVEPQGAAARLRIPFRQSGAEEDGKD
ncbi:MAG TPA: histidine kinase [Pyrinomonadaceae bacterium]|nr:histidine kinase [Pyrinomonadaceae bacterium]